ncbi:hypothetical protein [Pluralibacter gergoviae]|uniref:Glycosyl hydrolase n=1 Tax=Pluralibacter gergoviae TaxID=61647 RepID=A0AAW8HLL1_PLUGE|nr:hypothetical protein [Pluralibacter gergoviae]MDQ2309077.1 hypothetical protein [Pluralibacter gergoviae]
MNLKIKLIILSLSVTQTTYAFDKGIGIHPESENLSPRDYINFMEKYKFSSFRADYKWQSVEKKPNDFADGNSKTEKLINMANSKGIKPIIILNYGNPIYGIDRPLDENQRQHFNQYVNWVTTHLKGKVYAYEIWNEWSISKTPTFDGTSKNSAILYFKLVKQVSDTIHKNDSDAKILAGSFNPFSSEQRKWAILLVRLGILNYIDGISIHPYSSLNASSTPLVKHNIDTIDRLERLMKSNSSMKKNIDIYVTEIGFPTFKKSSYPQDEVAEYAVDFIKQTSKKNYIKGVWWYELVDNSENSDNKENNYGILYFNHKEKPIASKFKDTSSKLDK